MNYSTYHHKYRKQTSVKKNYESSIHSQGK